MRSQTPPCTVVGGSSSTSSASGSPSRTKARRTVVFGSWRKAHHRFRKACNSRAFWMTAVTKCAGGATLGGMAPSTPKAPNNSEEARCFPRKASISCSLRSTFAKRSAFCRCRRSSAMTSSWGMPRRCWEASSPVMALTASQAGSAAASSLSVALGRIKSPSASASAFGDPSESTREASWWMSRTQASPTLRASRKPSSLVTERLRSWPPVRKLPPFSVPCARAASISARSASASTTNAASGSSRAPPPAACSALLASPPGALNESSTSESVEARPSFESSPSTSFEISSSTRAGRIFATCSRKSSLYSSIVPNERAARFSTPSAAAVRASSAAISSSKARRCSMKRSRYSCAFASGTSSLGT
mmetsp:Transcript_62797/g.182130  ORF Transcript_62797/g.182130 Transcript_62797/m.182130 type:complete len:363 (+) Transcript_62797:132-1220(+)